MIMMVMMMKIMSDQCFNSPYCYTTQSKKGGEQKDEDEGDDNDEMMKTNLDCETNSAYEYHGKCMLTVWRTCMLKQ